MDSDTTTAGVQPDTNLAFASNDVNSAATPSVVGLAYSNDFAGATTCDLEAYGRFCRAMLDRGIYAPPSQFEAWFVSLAHDEAAIDRTAEAASEAFAEALA